MMLRIKRREGRRSVFARFVICFLLAFVLLAVAWGHLMPGYNKLVAFVAGSAFRVVETDDVTFLQARGDELWVERRDKNGLLEDFSYFDPYIYFGLVPLLALLAAIPGPGLMRRSRRALLGLALMFLIHVVYVVGSVEMTYAAVGLRSVSEGGRHVLDWAQIFLRILWQAAPVLIVALLGMDFWRDRLLVLRDLSRTGRGKTTEENSNKLGRVLTRRIP